MERINRQQASHLHTVGKDGAARNRRRAHDRRGYCRDVATEMRAVKRISLDDVAKFIHNKWDPGKLDAEIPGERRRPPPSLRTIRDYIAGL